MLELISKGLAYEPAIRLALRTDDSKLARQIVSALMSKEAYEAVAEIASKTSSSDLAAQINSELWWKDVAKLTHSTLGRLKFWS